MRVGRRYAAVVAAWVFCVLAAITVQTLGEHRDERHSEEQFQALAASQSSFVSAYVDDVFESERRLAPEVTAGEADSQALEDAVASSGFEAGLLLDRRGRAVAVAPLSHGVVGTDVAGRYPHLTAALRGQFAVSDVVPGAATGEPLVAFALPLFGDRFGVLSVGLQLSDKRLRSFLDQQIARGSQGYVVDSHGREVVAAGDAGDAAVLLGSMVEHSRRGPYVAGAAVVASAPVEGTPWTYVLRAPVADVLASTSAGAGRVWALLGALAALSLVAMLAATRALAMRSEARRERAESEGRFRLTVEHAPVGMTMVGLDHRFIEPNDRICRMLGYSAAELEARTFDEVTHPEDLDLDLTMVEQLLTGEIESYELEKRYLRRDGSTLWGRLTVSGVRGPDGRVPYFVSQVEDVTEIRAAQQQLELRAMYDPLTGLANRGLLVDRLTHALNTRGGGQVAVGFCDLDRFKQVNDTGGHHAGDEVLQAVAARLREVVRGGDTVARMGGDEFIVMLTDVGSVGEARAVMDRARAAVEEPIELDGGSYRVGLSGGLAVAQEGDTAETLLRHADTALYAAKHGGRGRCEVYNAGFRRSAAPRRALEDELRVALLAEDELVVHFQPVVDLVSLVPVAYEALVRWNHPRRGLLAPGEFIDVAEDSGQMVALSNVVLDSACRFLARHPDATWQVFVNVSPTHLGRDLPGSVLSALSAWSVPPTRLGLEITENGVLHASGSSLSEMITLRSHGIDILVDDFGTGYSALSSLMDTPVTGLKLDRSFTARLGQSTAADRITSTVANLMHSLALHGVAEGVETTEQADVLRAHGWRFAQGYLFGRPLPVHLVESEMAVVRAV